MLTVWWEEPPLRRKGWFETWQGLRVTRAEPEGCPFMLSEAAV